MYTIVVNQDNVLEKTHIERIMRKSKLVNNLRFLVPVQYNEISMDGFTAVLEYRLPISKDYTIEILTVQSELYANEYLDYRLPIDTKLTAEPGEVEIQLTFIKASLDASGNSTQYVRKTLPTTITITPIASWSDVVPDTVLTALDQRIIALNLTLEQLSNLADLINQNKADGIAIDGNQVQLTSNGERIGDPITLQQNYIYNTTGEMKVVEI